MATRNASRHVAAVILLSSLTACDRRPTPVAEAPPEALEVVPSVVALGVLRPGRSGYSSLLVRNRQAHAVLIESIETSCPCVQVSPTPLRVEPLGSTLMGVRFDATEEPEFRGSLSVEVSAKGPGGVPLFRARVKLTVSDADP